MKLNDARTSDRRVYNGQTEGRSAVDASKRSTGRHVKARANAEEIATEINRKKLAAPRRRHWKLSAFIKATQIPEEGEML